MANFRICLHLFIPFSGHPWLGDTFVGSGRPLAILTLKNKRHQEAGDWARDPCHLPALAATGRAHTAKAGKKRVKSKEQQAFREGKKGSVYHRTEPTGDREGLSAAAHTGAPEGRWHGRHGQRQATRTGSSRKVKHPPRAPAGARPRPIKPSPGQPARC